MTPPANRLPEIYDRMLRHYGPQHWWPADTSFEMMVGAVLTQAAAWSGVRRAISNLKAVDAMSPEAIRRMDTEVLANLVYPSVYHNSKARKLKALSDYLGTRFGDDVDAMLDEETEGLRNELLGVYGIGEETADDILLYAVRKPVFVIDAYTKRVFSRLGLVPEKESYAGYSAMFSGSLPADPDMFGEYHALIVRHAKETCRRRPLCGACCLLTICPTGQDALAGNRPIG